MTTDPEPTTPPAGPDLSIDDVLCVNCGYNLRGLNEDGRCPECGTVVERSIRGNLLVYSSGSYQRALLQGVTLVYFGVMALVGVKLVEIGGTIAVQLLAFGPASQAQAWLMPTFVGFIQMLIIGAEGMHLLGWWRFSEPDPSVLGTNTGQKARRIIRITLLISAVMVIGDAVGSVAAATLSNAASTLTPRSAIVIGSLAGAFGLLAIVAVVTKFFAAMVYVQWLAPRLPNEHVAQRAKTFMWLGPVLMVTAACTIGITYIVWLVLYLIMLNMIRQDITRIRAESIARFGEEEETFAM